MVDLYHMNSQWFHVNNSYMYRCACQYSLLISLIYRFTDKLICHVLLSKHQVTLIFFLHTCKVTLVLLSYVEIIPSCSKCNFKFGTWQYIKLQFKKDTISVFVIWSFLKNGSLQRSNSFFFFLVLVSTLYRNKAKYWGNIHC